MLLPFRIIIIIIIVYDDTTEGSGDGARLIYASFGGAYLY